MLDFDQFRLRFRKTYEEQVKLGFDVYRFPYDSGSSDACRVAGKLYGHFVYAPAGICPEYIDRAPEIQVELLRQAYWFLHSAMDVERLMEYFWKRAPNLFEPHVPSIMELALAESRERYFEQFTETNPFLITRTSPIGRRIEENETSIIPARE